MINYQPKTSNGWSNYNVGEKIPVYYDPHQPEKAITGKPFQLCFALTVFATVGGIFALFSALFLVVGLIFP